MKTKLPGIDSDKVIPSMPKLILEDKYVQSKSTKKIFAITFMVMFFILIPLLYLIAFGVIHANSVITTSKILLGFSSILAFSLAVEWSIDVLYMNGDKKIRLDRVDEVLLTPEVLEKCGFKKDEQHECYVISQDDDHELSFHYDSNVVLLTAGDNCTSAMQLAHIKYLHQLQNLYLALTGEELIYTP